MPDRLELAQVLPRQIIALVLLSDDSVGILDEHCSSAPLTDYAPGISHVVMLLN